MGLLEVAHALEFHFTRRVHPGKTVCGRKFALVVLCLSVQELLGREVALPRSFSRPCLLPALMKTNCRLSPVCGWVVQDPALKLLMKA